MTNPNLNPAPKNSKRDRWLKVGLVGALLALAVSVTPLFNSTSTDALADSDHFCVQATSDQGAVQAQTGGCGGEVSERKAQMSGTFVIPAGSPYRSTEFSIEFTDYNTDEVFEIYRGKTAADGSGTLQFSTDRREDFLASIEFDDYPRCPVSGFVHLISEMADGFSYGDREGDLQFPSAVLVNFRWQILPPADAARMTWDPSNAGLSCPA